jgi:signal peptide peptidase SppA
MEKQPEVTSVEPTQALLRGVETALKRPVLLDPRSVDMVLAATVFHVQARDTAPVQSEPFSRVGNVAVVDIQGPLAQRAWSCAGLFGGDGYDAIAERMLAAIADTETVGVLMNIDSPGGEVSACFECARTIKAAALASGKTVVAYANEMALSAGYALACAANLIVTPDTGAVGSVGAIITLIDQSVRVQQSGAAVHVISSGARKADGHPALPVNEDTLAVIQAEIDHIAGVFARDVAASRGLTHEAVLALEAGVFLGQNAIDKGLADRLGGLDVALKLAARERSRGRRPMEPGYAVHADDRHDAQGDPTPLENTNAAQDPHGDKKMKSLMIELGLTENASETEALKAVKATAARAERAEKAVARFLASTGQTDADAAAGVVDAWKVDAARAKVLDADNKEMRAKQVEADVDAMLADGRRTLRVLPAEVPALRAKGLEDPGWLKGYLAVKTSTAQIAPLTEPGREGEKVKSWATMTPQEKADLYHADRATYEALKAAAKATKAA